ncbi:MAG: nucleotidyl transferase AbiEii/AbiGii toxin family protein [Flavobacterium psychrophilum]|nr:MAG: nucleotidyl transferase AbiEii/AbiGii toxin family protein [Flavobacterium psychrophilum]
MIPQAYITEWSTHVPWQTNEQVEQDLVICRALVEIFSDKFLADRLAFRGGTALHKLYLEPQPRYSEDIDLVQITNEPFGPVIDALRDRLSFLGVPTRKQKENNNTLVFRFESEFPPVQRLRLKVETNCREHFSVLGLVKFPFKVESSWYKGSCEITTYQLEELLGTKLRALYQRRKGRDLYDLHKAFTLKKGLNTGNLIKCYLEYMKFSVGNSPSQQQFIDNMELKMKDNEFRGDITALLRPAEKYDHDFAYESVRTELLLKL